MACNNNDEEPVPTPGKVELTLNSTSFEESLRNSVNANGREFTQLIEKGLMGAVFHSKIYTVYLTDTHIIRSLGLYQCLKI